MAGLDQTGVTLAELAELAGAPWACRLVDLKVDGSVDSALRVVRASGSAAADSYWKLAPPTGCGLEPAFSGVALPSLRSLSLEYVTPLSADALLPLFKRASWLTQLESLEIRGPAASQWDLAVWEAVTDAAGLPQLLPGADCKVDMVDLDFLSR